MIRQSVFRGIRIFIVSFEKNTTFFFTLLIYIVNSLPVTSQTPLWVNSMPFSPSFFGPNSLPVPDFYPGRLDTMSKVTIATDLYWGKNDITSDVFARLDWALLPKLLTFSVWMVPVEYYSINKESAIERNLKTNQLTGFATGDVYVGTYITILREKNIIPGVVVGAVMRTASGGKVDAARFHDTPGYYFDLSVGKRMRHYSYQQVAIDISSSVGFLCWQTSGFRQNDAVMWGVKVGIDHRSLRITNEVGGYYGWQKNGDAPIVYKLECQYDLKKVILLAKYQIGITDFPYQQMRIGVTIPFHLNYGKLIRKL